LSVLKEIIFIQSKYDTNFIFLKIQVHVVLLLHINNNNNKVNVLLICNSKQILPIIVDKLYLQLSRQVFEIVSNQHDYIIFSYKKSQLQDFNKYPKL